LKNNFFKNFGFCLSAIMLDSSVILAKSKSEGGKKSCPALSMSTLEKEFPKDGKRKLIFFASWCSSCVDHLKNDGSSKKESADQNKVYIAAFDEKDAAEKVINKFKVSSPCYIDDGVVDALKVQGVPFEMTW